MDGIETRRVTVPRTARYAVLGSGPVEEAWVVAHGYGQLAARFLRSFQPIAAPGRLVIAPEGLSRFYVDGEHQRVGASWMTREDREAEIADYVRWLDTAYTDALERAETPRPERLVALGFSQGCATITRWLAESPMLPPRRCDRLVLWGGTLPHDLDVERHRAWLDGRLTLVAGDADEYATPERVADQEALLVEHGIGYEAVRFDGAHRLDEETLRRIATRGGG